MNSLNGVRSAPIPGLSIVSLFFSTGGATGIGRVGIHCAKSFTERGHTVEVGGCGHDESFASKLPLEVNSTLGLRVDFSVQNTIDQSENSLGA